MQKKLQQRKAVKVVSEACPHSSKADARERKKNRSIKLQKLWMDKKTKKAAIERTNDTLVGLSSQKLLFISRLVIKL